MSEDLYFRMRETVPTDSRDAGTFQKSMTEKMLHSLIFLITCTANVWTAFNFNFENAALS